MIEALLQHIYEAPLEFVARKEMSKSDLERLSTMENVQLAIELQTAADKVSLPAEEQWEMIVTN